MSKRRNLYYCLIIAVLLVFPAYTPAHAADPSPINVPAPNSSPSPFSNLNLGIPGSSATNPAQLVADIYNFALMIAGLLAFGSILYGGIMYLTTGGNPSAQSEAKNRIRDAIIGLLLLVGIYFVLNLINPDLTKLKFPSLTPIPAPVSSVSGPPPVFDPKADVWACQSLDDSKTNSACFSTEDGCKAKCDWQGDPANSIPPTENCVQVKGNACPENATVQSMHCSTGNCVDIGLPWEYKNGKRADPVMVKELQCLANAGIVLRITEAMPPTVQHLSHRHTDGCAVDATVPAVTSAKDCSKICDLQQQVINCGGTSLNEYYTLCANTSCPGTNTEHATADHVHINASCY